MMHACGGGFQTAPVTITPGNLHACMAMTLVIDLQNWSTKPRPYHHVSSCMPFEMYNITDCIL